MEKPNFVYQEKMSFNKLNTDTQLQYEKHKYLRGIVPEIERLKKEIKKNKKLTKKEKQKIFNSLIRGRKNHRTLRYQHENGEIYPKEISIPIIYYIQYPEPHVIITDWYDENQDWYVMPQSIKNFAEEAYLSYEMGLWYSAIASAINCCEYVLKYELLRKLNKTDKGKAISLSKDRYFSLGSFIEQGNDYLKQIRLKKLHKKIEYLNDVRISIYHFSPERAQKVNKKGTLEVEKDAPISDGMVIPIIACKVYSIMYELTSSLYNKDKALEYVKEGVKDWMKKRGFEKGEINDETNTILKRKK